MKTLLGSALALGMMMTVLPVAGAEDQTDNGSSATHGHWLTSEYSLTEPFDPAELKELTTDPDRDERRLMLLILRAGIEKDESFQYLLDKAELRKRDSLDLALSGYDFMMNRSETALDNILAELATENVGADANEIVVLSALDEWDRSIPAFRKHFFRTDGAGGLCMVSFKLTRAYLYPEEYEKRRDYIEAPIK